MIGAIQEKLVNLQYNIRIFKRIYRLYKIIKYNCLSKTQSSQSLFIFGTQRSGTDMLLNFFHNMPFTITYNQYHKKSFKNGRIRTDIEHWDKFRSKYPLCVAKPLFNSHEVIELLNLLNGKAIWIYRDYYDTSLSAGNTWNYAQRGIIQSIVDGYPNVSDWYGYGISRSDYEIIKQLSYSAISELEAGVLKWYLRNKLFYNQKLNRNPKVLLVKYEDLVLKPKQNFTQITEFLFLESKSYFHCHVHSRSIRKIQRYTINTEIEKLAKGLLARLNTHKHTIS